MTSSIKTKIHVEGLSELEKALQEIPRATGGNVLKRAIVKPAQMFADHARELAPKESGKLKQEIKVSKPKVISAGKAAFAAAMREGATRAEAGHAARAANAAAGGAGGAIGVGLTVMPLAFCCLMKASATRFWALASCSASSLAVSAALALASSAVRLATRSSSSSTWPSRSVYCAAVDCWCCTTHSGRAW